MKIYRLIILLFFGLLFSHATTAQVVTKDEEKFIKEGIVRFLLDFEGFLNQIGNSNVEANTKQHLIDENFARFFRNEEVTVEQDLNPKGKDRSVKLKTARVYLNNIGVYYFNIVMHFDSVAVKGIYRNEEGIFAIANFNRSFDALDRNGEYVTSNILPREAYLSLQKVNGEWTWKLKSISFYEEKNIDNLRIDIAQKGKFINITSPERGTRIELGGGFLISWQDNIDEDVRIELLNGNSLVQVIEESTASDGEYERWTVPQQLASSTSYRIRIMSNVNANIIGTSKNFTIEPRMLMTKEEINKKRFYFGLRGNGFLSFISGNGLGMPESSNRLGGGIFTGMNLGQNFTSSVGFEMAQYGNQVTINDKTESMKLDYLRIPVLFGYYPKRWDRPSIRYIFGPALHLLQQAELTLQNGANSETIVLDEQIAKVDIGINAGLGYALPIKQHLKITADLLYYNGISNLLANPIGTSEAFNSTDLFFNRNLTVSIGFIYVP